MPALEHAAAHRDERLVEAQIAVGGDPAQHLVDHRSAGVEIDRRAGDRQRVDPLGIERGVDRGQPAALAVADQVHAPAAVLDRAVDHVHVVLDRGIPGLAGGAHPVERERPLEPGFDDRAHLALLGRVVDDARVVAGLGREHQGRDHAAARDREVAQPGQRRLEHDLVRGGPGRLLALGGGSEPPWDVKRRWAARERGGPAAAEAVERGRVPVEPAVEEAGAQAGGGDRGTVRG